MQLFRNVVLRSTNQLGVDMPISWTKVWAGTDDGTLLHGIDLKNIQEDLAGVLSTSDVGSNADIVTYEGVVVVYEGDVVFA